MKLIFSFLTAFILFFQSGLESLRESYAKANSSNANTEEFINIAEKTSGSDAVIQGYKAAAKIMEAKITKNNRKALVKSGATSLEAIIKSNPNNAELRVIRMSVQENIPKIVGYNKNLKEDKTFILNNYSKQNSALKTYIRKFAMQSKTMTAAEKNSLK
ncbi:hypothetical protein ACFO4P_06110 [Epilithonimonas pallida]|uniref:DUF4142 domain-containing protein n=1 Tax=Epilithonimonas pallida TaxID=373671 RepID=A0ABY1R7T2_9FLAO|nr:hypothetical protein [Epilithonimonas pallida]SMP96443.1 hypothetical protein SAMN05421679_10938 [Epilithonimonas pallida]